MKRCFTILFIIVFIGGSSAFLNACKKTGSTASTTIIPFEIPAGFPNPVHNFSSEPLTKEGIALGQRLFYDGILSKDGLHDCASCHEQGAAFTTYEHDLSHGYNHFHTTRNATALSNLAWSSKFRKDGSADNMSSVSIGHIIPPKEMGENLVDVLQKLNSDEKYRQLFHDAFGTGNINSARMLDALKQFMLSMVSANSKYDKVKKGEAAFTLAEQAGYEIFKTKCTSCHTEPLFTDNSYRNIGLPPNPSIEDYGRFSVTKNKADSFKFIVPSLRNVALTSYYMHDGRLSSLQKSIEHYRTGIVKSTTLDPLLTNGISLTSTNVTNLISFLKTLSDSSYIKDKRFAKPLF